MDGIVRLSVNLAGDVASVLKYWCGKKGISATEGIRRAIALTRFVRAELAQGNTLAIVERRCDRTVVREIEFIDL